MKPNPLEPKENVTVVISTFNSEKTLARCLTSLTKQTSPCIEILVVDNYSTDKTRQVAQAFNANVHTHKGTPAAARNLGFLKSTAPYVLFLDSDQYLKVDAVEKCIQTCNSSGVEAVKIPEVFVWETFWGHCSAFWKNRMVKAWGQTGGLPRFFKRDALLSVSAFKSELRFWEDQELHQRLKAAGVKEGWCSSHVFHCESGSLKAITVKYLMYGQSVVAFSKTKNRTPHLLTANLTLRTLFEVMRTPGRSVKLFLGFCLLFTVKSMCATLGFVTTRISVKNYNT